MYDLISKRVRVHLYNQAGITVGALTGRVADVAPSVEVAPGMKKDLAYVVDIETGDPDVPYRNSSGMENEGWFAIQDLEIIDGYVGLGYAKSRDEELAVMRDLARREAIVLDPVYTGKAFFGIVEELRRNPTRFGERIVFVHTGGIFGLFPAAEQISALL